MAAETWTYTHDPAYNMRDCIRFLIQDTDETDCQFSDSEIFYFVVTYKRPRLAAISAGEDSSGKVRKTR